MVKKIFVLGVALLMILGLVACGEATVPDEPTHKQTNGEFVLTISVDEAEFRKGLDIKVTAVFENASVNSFEISHSSTMIVPIVVNSEHYGGNAPMDVVRSTLAANDEIEASWEIGSKLPKGKHELVAIASFNILQVESGKVVSSQPVRVVSNTIVIMVK